MTRLVLDASTSFCARNLARLDGGSSEFSSMTWPRAVFTMLSPSASEALGGALKADGRSPSGMRAVDRHDAHMGKRVIEALPVCRAQILLHGGGRPAAGVIIDRKAQSFRAPRHRPSDPAHAE